MGKQRYGRFSLDTLVNMLSDAGLEVDIRIKPPSRRVVCLAAAGR